MRIVELAAIETEWLTPPQVAQVMGVNPTTVRGWIRCGKLPAVKSGRAYRVKRTDVDALRETKTPPPPKKRRKTDISITRYF